jgi:hypothetical protein
VYDDELQNLEASLEALKELVFAQQVHIREIEQERDLLMSWYRTLVVRSPAIIGEDLIQIMQ